MDSEGWTEVKGKSNKKERMLVERDPRLDNLPVLPNGPYLVYEDEVAALDAAAALRRNNGGRGGYVGGGYGGGGYRGGERKGERFVESSPKKVDASIVPPFKTHHDLIYHICSIEKNKSVLDKRHLFLTIAPSGCGKTTWSKAKAEEGLKTFICSADDFFDKDGTEKYNFNPSLLSIAHLQCFNRFVEAIQDESNINLIVCNTNLEWPHIEKYIDEVIALDNFVIHFCFLHIRTPEDLEKSNSHGVGKEILQRMIDRALKMREGRNTDPKKNLDSLCDYHYNKCLSRKLVAKDLSKEMSTLSFK